MKNEQAEIKETARLHKVQIKAAHDSTKITIDDLTLRGVYSYSIEKYKSDPYGITLRMYVDDLSFVKS